MSGLEVIANPGVTFRVLVEDADFLIVEKPSRVVTQPGVGHEHDTLLNGLFARYGERLAALGHARDFGLVHRLDKETSGVLVVGLSRAGYDGLRAQFEARTVRKFYWALCQKAPSPAEGVIRKPIAELLTRTGKYTQQKTARISSSGEAAVTAYRTLAASGMGALIEARPVTGRLHQVRVHLASIGAAVLGDEVYGTARAAASSPRVALHAHRIVVRHPVGGEEVEARTRWPGDLRTTLRRLELPRPEGLEAGDGVDADE